MKTKEKLVALSLFSNVGIAETYFNDIGIEVAVANELLPERAKFYEHLYPETKMICGDITDSVVFEKVKQEALQAKINFLIATPPCQGMSNAGIKNPIDERNYLIYYAVEMIKELRPDYVILENVYMITKYKIDYNGKEMYIPAYIEHELGSYYTFNTNRIVNTMNYGIPQSRERYICLLTKKELGITWEFPQKEENIVTLEDTIGKLPSLDPLLREECERWRFPDFEKKRIEGAKISKWHYPPTHSWRQVEWLMHTPSGTSAFKNEIYYPKKDNRKIKGAIRTYMRMFWHKPATTVMQNSGVISAFSTVHPGRKIYDDGNEETRVYSDARTLSIYELLIVSSLPTDWDIPDWASEILIRKVIGEGIPPLLIKKALEVIV